MDYKLQHQLQQLPKHSIIMISGFGGSGKSTLASEISLILNASIITIDDFYQHILTSKAWSCYEFTRFVTSIIMPFKQHRSSTYNAYNWENPDILLVKTFIPKEYLIIEGVGLFHPEVLPHVDYSVWIDCPIDIAVQRGIQRDLEEYGVDNKALWNGVWKQDDLESYDLYKPKEHANYIYTCPE